MRRIQKAPKKNGAAISLFPFLAVLLCTMGALIVLLVFIAGQASLEARAPTASKPVAPPTPELQAPILSPPVPSPEPPIPVPQPQPTVAPEPVAPEPAAPESKEPEPAKPEPPQFDRRAYERRLAEHRAAEVVKQEMEKQIARIKHQMPLLEHRLEVQRRKLTEAETLLTEQRRRWAQLDGVEAELARDSKVVLDRDAMAQQLADAERALADAESKLTEAQRAARERKPSFAVVPFEGPYETRRRPIYIECRADSIIVQPEGIVLSEDDFRGPMGPTNALASVIRSMAEFLQRNKHTDTGDAGRPYPLLLVRPSGIGAYYAARGALQHWETDFGYEMIDEEMELAFQSQNPEMAVHSQMALREARIRQRTLIAGAPSLYRGIASEPVFRIPGAKPASSERMPGGSGTSALGGGDSSVAGGFPGSGSPNGASSGDAVSGNPALGDPSSGLVGSNGSGGSNHAGMGPRGAYAPYSSEPSHGGPSSGVPGGRFAPGGGDYASQSGGPGGNAAGSPGPYGQPSGPNGAAGGTPGSQASYHPQTGAPGAFASNQHGGPGDYAANPGGQPTHGQPNQVQPSNDPSQSGPYADGFNGQSQQGTGADGQAGQGQGQGTGGAAQQGNGSAVAASADGAGEPNAHVQGNASQGNFSQANNASGQPRGASSRNFAANGSMNGSASGGSSGGTSGSSGGSSGGAAGMMANGMQQNQGEAWSPQELPKGSIGVRRLIKVECFRDRLVVAGKVIPLDRQPPEIRDDLLKAVGAEVKRWGISGHRMHWLPGLMFEVTAGGQGWFDVLAPMLQSNGLEVSAVRSRLED